MSEAKTIIAESGEVCGVGDTVLIEEMYACGGGDRALMVVEIEMVAFDLDGEEVMVGITPNEETRVLAKVICKANITSLIEWKKKGEL